MHLSDPFPSMVRRLLAFVGFLSFVGCFDWLCVQGKQTKHLRSHRLENNHVLHEETQVRSRFTWTVFGQTPVYIISVFFFTAETQVSCLHHLCFFYSWNTCLLSTLSPFFTAVFTCFGQSLRGGVLGGGNSTTFKAENYSPVGISIFP